MRMIAALGATMAGPALADTVRCDLSGVPVQFDIDRSQFAPALDPNEPPQRRVTTVKMNGTEFPAEPILMNGFSGFAVEEDGNPLMMLVIDPQGTATLKDAVTNTELSGTCETTQ